MGNTSSKDKPKSFLDLFQDLCKQRSPWEIWADFVTAAACEISVSVDAKTSEKRADEHASIMSRYSAEEQTTLAQMFAETVNALDRNPEQDYLGEMYMQLNLGNHWKGQFFTPYNICALMSQVQSENAAAEIQKKGWTSVIDPASGAGATLISFANSLYKQGINYQTTTLFCAQDLDRVTAMMCYVQLSLLGCAGYVAVGDSLRHPVNVGAGALLPVPDADLDLWYTPMFFADVWKGRRAVEVLKQWTAPRK